MAVEGDESSQLRMANSSLSRLPALIDSPDHVRHFFFYCFSIILGKGEPMVSLLALVSCSFCTFVSSTTLQTMLTS